MKKDYRPVLKIEIMSLLNSSRAGACIYNNLYLKNNVINKITLEYPEGYSCNLINKYISLSIIFFPKKKKDYTYIIIKDKFTLEWVNLSYILI